MWEPNIHRRVTCVVCGKDFKDDCGENICSSSCYKEYDREHGQCEDCEEHVGVDYLVNGRCENCWEEYEHEMKDEEHI